MPMWDRIGKKYGNNHLVAAAFPNDSDGNAFRAVFPEVAQVPGLQLRPFDGLHDGLTNYTSMISQFKSLRRRLLHQRAAAARLRHHVDPGAAAGLQAQARHRRQGPAVPDRRLRHGQQGLQHRHRQLVGAVAAVDVVPHRADLPAARGRLHRGGPRAAEREHLQLHPLRDRLRGAHLGERPAQQARAGRRPVQGQAARRPWRARSTTPRARHPAPGVAITPPVGIQWQKGTKYPLEAKVVDNTLQPNAKITGDLLPTFKSRPALCRQGNDDHSIA